MQSWRIDQRSADRQAGQQAKSLPQIRGVVCAPENFDVECNELQGRRQSKLPPASKKGQKPSRVNCSTQGSLTPRSARGDLADLAGLA